MRIISPGWKSWENTAVLPESTNPIWNIVSAKAANPETNWNQQPWLTMSTDTPVTAGSEAVFFSVLMLYMEYGNIATVHFVHSNVAKIHSRLPAAMEFWLVCLGILAYSCQNTSRDSGVWTVTFVPWFTLQVLKKSLTFFKTVRIITNGKFKKQIFGIIGNGTSFWMVMNNTNL